MLLILILVIFIIISIEFSTFFIAENVRKKFQWLITYRRDEVPILDKEGLNKFFEHGYDPELGWIRNPNTKRHELGKHGKTIYHINNQSSRLNPNHESLPIYISCYGDSFCFCRQVNDNETWEWFLSEYTKSNVLNFGVGNYGVDQALIRLQREYHQNKSSVVIMCVVPSTIVRILCVWKHYNEYGNTFGFKPRFELHNGKLIKINNIIDKKEKFYNYEKYLPEIKKHDYFYETKFKKEMIQFPYLLHLLKNPKRNLTLIFRVLLGRLDSAMMKIMEINLKLRYNLFSKKEVADLFRAIIQDFIGYGKKQGFKPVFIIIPQKDDVLFIKKHKNYYHDFLQSLKKDLLVIDLTDYLEKREDLDDLYSDDNKYGGHPSRKGNEFIAQVIKNVLSDHKYV